MNEWSYHYINIRILFGNTVEKKNKWAGSTILKSYLLYSLIIRKLFSK